MVHLIKCHRSSFYDIGRSYDSILSCKNNHWWSKSANKKDEDKLCFDPFGAQELQIPIEEVRRTIVVPMLSRLNVFAVSMTDNLS